MKYFNLTLLLFFFYNVSYSQNTYLEGSVADSILKKGVMQSAVMILNSKDSVLRAHQFTGSDGKFRFFNIPAGDYLLLVLTPGYTDYAEKFTITTARKNMLFPPVYLISQSRLLNEVLVKGQYQAIKIKGDTSIYNAKAFVIQPNDNVEELLKQLPSIQVDKDGRISAEGKVVRKVLLNGEEFFGDDPTLITRNIRADMVASIQVYDSKSKAATLTGIEDGVKEKTINIQLKEDKEDGLFGKALASTGTGRYYDEQLLANRFRAKEKYAGYFTASSTGKTDIGTSDEDRIGAATNSQFTDDGLIMITGGADELNTYDGKYNGRGLPKALSGGFHYDATFDGDRKKINANLKLGELNLDGSVLSLNQQEIPQNIISYNNTATFKNNSSRQKANLAYTATYNKTTELKLGFTVLNRDFHSIDDNFSRAYLQDQASLYEIRRRYDIDGNQKKLGLNIALTKKFRKEHRSLLAEINGEYNQIRENGTLNSLTDFYSTNAIPDSSVLIDQFKSNRLKTSVLRGDALYTEPLAKNVTLSVSYSIGLNKNVSDRLSFNPSGSGQYTVPDTAFSNSYRFNQLLNQFGSGVNFTWSRGFINIGAKLLHNRFAQKNMEDQSMLNRTFFYALPNSNMQFKLSQQGTINFNYSAALNQPQIEQIQPLQNNNDPVNIVVGNPNLNPSYNHKFSLSLNLSRPVKGESLYFNSNYALTDKPISLNTITNPLTGQTTFTFTNLSHYTAKNYYAGLNMNKRIQNKNITIGLYLYTNGTISYNSVNNVIGQTTNRIYSGRLNFSVRKTQKYNFYASAGPSYLVNEFSLNRENSNNAPAFTTSSSVTLFLPFKLQLASDVYYTHTAATGFFPKQNITLLNMSLSKSALKNEALKIAVSGNDLLNRNILFTRMIQGNLTSQSNTSSIRRYFLLSLSWSFNQFKKVPSNQ